MTLPAALRGAVEAALGPLGGAAPVAGGSISAAHRVETAGGPVFLKHHDGAPAGMFAAEAAGLARLAAAGCGLRVPRVLARGDTWIALEWLAPAPRDRDFGARLGRGLAALHAAPISGWGGGGDGFLGTLPQPDAPAPTWAAFWRARRLEPLLRRARDAGRLPGAPADWARLLDRLPDLLGPAEADGPSLVHGDLWSGNVLATEGGPALVDPAAHHGHGEVDLAMAALFGGFPPDFAAAYREARPAAPGDEAARRTVYQLYYLLAHVVLFGGGYVARTAEALRRVA